MADTIITVTGNLTADPELRYTPSGHAVANFTIASTPRIRDRQSGEFRDGDPLFLRCSLWRDYAEHVASSLQKGSAVIAQGKLKQRSYETREGEKRTTVELEVDEIGPTLRFATATVQRTQGGGSGRGGGWAGPSGGSSGGWAPEDGRAAVGSQNGAQRPAWANDGPAPVDYEEEPPF